MNAKIYFTLVSIVVILLACGSGEPSKKGPKVEAPKVNAIDKVSAKKNTAKATTEQSTEGTAEATTASMTPEQIAKAKKLIKAATQEQLDETNPAKIYKMHCALCHGFNGKMMVNGAKDLTKATLPLEESVAQVYFGKGLMQPYKGVLTDPEIVAISKYVEEQFR